MVSVQVMYMPLKDLNGIPGAKNLVVCLTGYLRHDRDDIMVRVLVLIGFLLELLQLVVLLLLCLILVFSRQTMVALMGAEFSKPLVASKVTHLICYKFEGLLYTCI